MSAERFSYAKTGLVRAEAKHVRSSARKARLVLADIRGRNVLDARKQLLFSPRAVATTPASCRVRWSWSRL